jgi:hypothetical protein
MEGTSVSNVRGLHTTTSELFTVTERNPRWRPVWFEGASSDF